jgi:hypothetical protein
MHAGQRFYSPPGVALYTSTEAVSSPLPHAMRLTADNVAHKANARCPRMVGLARGRNQRDDRSIAMMLQIPRPIPSSPAILIVTENLHDAHDGFPCDCGCLGHGCGLHGPIVVPVFDARSLLANVDAHRSVAHAHKSLFFHPHAIPSLHNNTKLRMCTQCHAYTSSYELVGMQSQSQSCIDAVYVPHEPR